MKKTILFPALFSSALLIQGQVGINTLTPAKTLDINGELRIRTLNPNTPSDNILAADSGGNIRKIPRNVPNISSPSGFSNTILGYEPRPAAARPQPPVLSGYFRSQPIELGCKQWSVNHHIYCAYRNTYANWFEAFIFAKQMGGYLVTMPSHAERSWVHTHIVDAGTGYNLQSNIWIGFNKIRRPGNPDRLQWITGEEFVINWATNPATAEHWFAPGEPSNTGGNEGPTLIWNSSASSSRNWNDLNGMYSSFNYVNMNELIIEFNE